MVGSEVWATPRDSFTYPKALAEAAGMTVVVRRRRRAGHRRRVMARERAANKP